MAYDDNTKIKINLDEMVIEASYSGPKLDKIEDITP